MWTHENVLKVSASRKAELFEHVLLHRGSAGPVSYSSLFESNAEDKSFVSSSSSPRWGAGGGGGGGRKPRALRTVVISHPVLPGPQARSAAGSDSNVSLADWNETGTISILACMNKFHEGSIIEFH